MKPMFSNQTTSIFRIRKTFFLAVVVLLGFSISAFADNSECWGISGDDKRRPEISCKPLTEKFLLSLRDLTRQQVIMAMGAAGQPVDNGGLHYIANTKTYSGFMLITFSNDRVSNIDATVLPTDDAHALEFIWSTSDGMCSDFPKSKHHCNN